MNVLSESDVIHYAKLPKWTARDTAFLLQNKDPENPETRWLEEKGLNSKLDIETEKKLDAILQWLCEAGFYKYPAEHNEATPLEFIALGTHYGDEFPVALKEAVKKYQKPKPAILQRPSKQNIQVIKKPTKQKRDNALHDELETFFMEWKKPDTNKECWNKLKSISFGDRDNTVIQEVVDNFDRDKCKILWEERGKERTMSRATFDNRIGIIRRKLHS